jgi:hypothetical protein
MSSQWVHVRRDTRIWVSTRARPSIQKRGRSDSMEWQYITTLNSAEVIYQVGDPSDPFNQRVPQPPVPAPVSPVQFPLNPIRWQLLGRPEYYLSPQNMASDFFLRQWVSPRNDPGTIGLCTDCHCMPLCESMTHQGFQYSNPLSNKSQPCQLPPLAATLVLCPTVATRSPFSLAVGQDGQTRSILQSANTVVTA